MRSGATPQRRHSSMSTALSSFCFSKLVHLCRNVGEKDCGTNVTRDHSTSGIAVETINLPNDQAHQCTTS